MKIKHVVFSTCLLFGSSSSQAIDTGVIHPAPLEFLKAINIPTPSLKPEEPDTASHTIFLNQSGAYSAIQAININFLEDALHGQSIVQEAILSSIVLQQLSSTNSFQAINYIGSNSSL